MTEHDDKMLDDFLKGGSPYSQRYQELPADEVPLELDAAILSASRQASVAKPLQRWRRWSVPVAVAATIVLAVAIVIDTPMKQASVSLPQPAAAPAVEQDAPALKAEREISGVVDADKAALAASSDARRDAESAKDARARDELAKKQKTESAQTVVTTAQRRQEALQRVPIAIQSEAPARSPAPLAAPPPPPPVAVNQPQSAASLAEYKPELAKTDSAAAPSPGAAEPTRAKQPEKAVSNLELQDVVVTGQLRRQSPSSGAGPRNSIAPAQKSDETLAREERESDPPQWLDYIRKLRSGVDQQRADREWAKFVKAYPNYVVPLDDVARPK
jgi:hypothetical protein